MTCRNGSDGTVRCAGAFCVLCDTGNLQDNAGQRVQTRGWLQAGYREHRARCGGL